MATNGLAVQTFSITDLAREFGVTTRTIRFYEDQHLLLPQRQGNRRVYSRRDRVRLLLILRGKRIGLSLQEIRELFDLYDGSQTGSEQLHEFVQILTRREEQLLAQKADIDRVLKEITQLRQQCERALEPASGRLGQMV